MTLAQPLPRVRHGNPILIHDGKHLSHDMGKCFDSLNQFGYHHSFRLASVYGNMIDVEDEAGAWPQWLYRCDTGNVGVRHRNRLDQRGGTQRGGGTHGVPLLVELGEAYTLLLSWLSHIRARSLRILTYIKYVSIVALNFKSHLEIYGQPPPGFPTGDPRLSSERGRA